MKVLVSAYACNPYGGSEPGVGWAAVCRIARNHDVWVLADSHNREGWERGEREGIIPANVKVRFLREYRRCSENRFRAHVQSWLNFREFSSKVLQEALRWHNEIGFEICHQVTVAAWRMPSELWRLPVPFVWGPIGGAGYIPPDFRTMLSPSARLFERARDLNTAMVLRSKRFQDCINETSTVFAANEETEELLRPHRGKKPLVRLPIVSISEEKAKLFARAEEKHDGRKIRLFAGGNMEGRKGVSLAIRALARVKAAGIDFHYTIAGGGPEIPALKNLAAEMGLGNEVEFHPGFRGPEYIKALHETDVYFLPSFRESTPVTLLEAYLAGCYPIVADTSAQGEIVRMAGGTAVPVASVKQVIEDLASAVVAYAHERQVFSERMPTARTSVRDFFSAGRYDAALDAAYNAAK